VGETGFKIFHSSALFKRLRVEVSPLERGREPCKEQHNPRQATMGSALEIILETLCKE
jgi:hypothetical protein